MAVGAYACYNLVLRLPEIPLIASFIISGLFAALVGVLFGLPSLRIKGFYLAVTTLASQFFLLWLFDHVGWFTNYDPAGVALGADHHAVRPACRSRGAARLPRSRQRPGVRAPGDAGSQVPRHPGRRRGPHPARQEPRAQRHGTRVDGDPGHGHRGRDHRRAAPAHPVGRVRDQLVLLRRRRRDVRVHLRRERGHRGRSTSSDRSTSCS